jgi:hypothetical protein
MTRNPALPPAFSICASADFMRAWPARHRLSIDISE